MIEIIPAILPKSFAGLEERLALIREATRAVQVDVVDGIFAPNKTWPYESDESFEKIISQEEGLPFWEDFDFEFDCMVSNPALEIPKFLAAGASRIVVHGAGKDILDTLEGLQLQRAGDLGTMLGIALLPGDEAGTFAQYKELVDFVQVMGIYNVGFQGSEFDERALGLIAALHANNPDVPIQVDGGVNLENARAIADAGATRLVVGSAIFKSDDPRAAIEMLKKEANKSGVQ